MKLLSPWRTDKSFFLYTDSSGIGGSWTSPGISWVTQELINLSYAWFFFGSSWRSHKALQSLKKNWQISFPCRCNLLVFSSLSVGSLKVANFFLSWLLSSLIFLLSQNSPSCFSVSYIPPSLIRSFPLLGFFLFLFLFMFHLQGFGVLLLLWVISVKVESMNVVTETRDICMYMGEIKRCHWAEKSLEVALNCSFDKPWWVLCLQFSFKFRSVNTPPCMFDKYQGFFQAWCVSWLVVDKRSWWCIVWSQDWLHCVLCY
jgi:hypothetical protein